MEPVTHFLTGACIGHAGLNRKTAYATLAAVLAAEAADIDVLWALGGPVEELKHHRGISHTFLAVPLVAAAAVGVVWLIDRGWQKWRERQNTSFFTPKVAPCPILSAAFRGKSAERVGNRSGQSALLLDAHAVGEIPGLPPLRQHAGARMGHGIPLAGNGQSKIHWGWLYLTACLAALSHLFLDWTNNYGLRPFYPFNPRWYAGSFVFIAEPMLWALLLAAMILPWLFGLTDNEIGAKRRKYRGSGWAIFALCGMVILWCGRWAEQAQARAMIENVQVAAGPVKRFALEPYPLNPFRWHAILETEGYFQTAEIDTRTHAIDTDPRRDIFYKPSETAAVEAAKRTPLGQVYLDWGSWAVVRDVGQQPIEGIEPPRLPPNRTWTTVEFSDLRFAYPFLGAQAVPGRKPLSGAVYIVDGRDDGGEMLNGRVQQ
jgi:inner membrane protein